MDGSIHYGRPSGPEFIKPLTSKRENGAESFRKAGPQIYFISNKISLFYTWQINNLSYKLLLQLQFFHNPPSCFCQVWTGSDNLSEIPAL